MTAGSGTALESMTGYGESAMTTAGLAIRMTMRSVNGKGLDIRFRLPPGCEAAEPVLKEQLAARLGRGNLQVAVTIDQDEPVSGVVIDETLFEQIAVSTRALATRTGLAAPTVGDILAVRGVITTAERAARDETGARSQTVMDALPDLSAKALDHLVAMRRTEGVALRDMIVRQMQTIRDCVARARVECDANQAAASRRIAQQVAALLDSVGSGQLDADRLHAEAALIAVRSDISEELDRLGAHTSAIDALVSEGGLVGRKLEFLAQELNREANTLCSKAPSLETTNIGLELKSVIDQFREQCANIQ